MSNDDPGAGLRKQRIELAIYDEGRDIARAELIDLSVKMKNQELKRRRG